MKRVQMRRGVKLPPNTKSVARPSPYGNPFLVGVNRHGPTVREAARILGLRATDAATGGGGQRHTGQGVAPVKLTRSQAVAAYSVGARAMLRDDPEWLAPLRGHDLACWCDPSVRCHADVLLELLAESAAAVLVATR